jgi:hypothetical protein
VSYMSCDNDCRPHPQRQQYFQNGNGTCHDALGDMHRPRGEESEIGDFYPSPSS